MGFHVQYVARNGEMKGKFGIEQVMRWQNPYGQWPRTQWNGPWPITRGPVGEIGFWSIWWWNEMCGECFRGQDCALGLFWWFHKLWGHAILLRCTVEVSGNWTIKPSKYSHGLIWVWPSVEASSFAEMLPEGFTQPSKWVINLLCVEWHHIYPIFSCKPWNGVTPIFTALSSRHQH